MNRRHALLVVVLSLVLLPGPTWAAEPLKVGVTLHPYYSWTKNVAGKSPVEVRPVVPGNIDIDNFQPSPDDIQRLADLDAIVVNGVGHDDVVLDMIKASGNAKITLIRPNDATPQLRAPRGERVNAHTFISITNAIRQTYEIQKALAALRPDLADTLQKNASAYARRLRALKTKYDVELVNAKRTRVVTVHEGYSYLLQEFGIDLAGVVEPAHGLLPSPVELKEMADLLRREKIRVVFSEERFPDQMLRPLREASAARVYVLSHIATGDYTAEKFEKEMEENLRTMIKALVKD